MLNYSSQVTNPIIGTKAGTTRTAATLTAAYTGNRKAFEVGGFSKLNLDILYTMGATEAGNTIEVQIESSPDGTNWYALPVEANTNGESTLYARNWKFTGSDAAAATISIGLDIFYKHVRVSVKESGVATNAGTVYIEATLSGQ